MSVKVREGRSVVDSLLVGGDEASKQNLGGNRVRRSGRPDSLSLSLSLSLKGFLSGGAGKDSNSDPGYVPVKFRFP